MRTPDVSFATHVTSPPTLGTTSYWNFIGDSRVDVNTLEPKAALSVKREPAGAGQTDGPYRQNEPWGRCGAWKRRARAVTRRGTFCT